MFSYFMAQNLHKFYEYKLSNYTITVLSFKIILQFRITLSVSIISYRMFRMRNLGNLENFQVPVP